MEITAITVSKDFAVNISKYDKVKLFGSVTATLGREDTPEGVWNELSDFLVRRLLDEEARIRKHAGLPAGEGLPRSLPRQSEVIQWVMRKMNEPNGTRKWKLFMEKKRRQLGDNQEIMPEMGLSEELEVLGEHWDLEELEMAWRGMFTPPPAMPPTEGTGK